MMINFDSKYATPMVVLSFLLTLGFIIDTRLDAYHRVLYGRTTTPIIRCNRLLFITNTSILTVNSTDVGPLLDKSATKTERYNGSQQEYNASAEQVVRRSRIAQVCNHLKSNDQNANENPVSENKRTWSPVSAVKQVWIRDYADSLTLNPVSSDALTSSPVSTDRATWSPVSTDRMDFILIDKRHRLIYGEVPKVASSNWLHVLINLTGDVTVDFQHPNRNLYHITDRKFLHRIGLTYMDDHPGSVAHILRDYYKFMFVRHPFTRLLSAYRNKLNPGEAYYKRRYGTEIHKLFGRNTSKSLKHSGKGVTFGQFIQYLIYLWRSHRFLDEHWRPQADLTFPCHIHYDFIGHLEHFDDAQYVLRHGFGFSHPPSFPTETSSHRTGSNDTETKKVFKNIPEEHKDVLRQIYREDFLLFGYDENKY